MLSLTPIPEVFQLPLLAASFNQGLFLSVLIAVLVVFILGMIFIFDRLLALSSETYIKDGSKLNYSVFPGLKDRLWKAPVPVVIAESPLRHAPYTRLKRGFDIKIMGSPGNEIVEYRATTYAVNPRDLKGISPIPKIEVEIGDEVKAGDVLFYDKKNPKVKYTAPVSGEIVEINRGAKRAIEDVVILADQKTSFRKFEVGNLELRSRDALVEDMLNSGLWPMIRQRPYNEIAEYDEIPRGIYISTFDSHPLAPDYNFTLAGQDRYFQAGLNVLARLTDGDVHLGLNAGTKPADLFVRARNVRHHWFEGKHPAGNVGIQIHHIEPILKGQIVWTVSPEDVITIGEFFLEGIYDPTRIVALGGPDVRSPKYFKTRLGARIGGMLDDNLDNDHIRVISGNVLTGKQVDREKGHLGFFHNQVSVVEEGDEYELFGWLLPSYMRPSLSKTFPAALFPDYEHRVNTNTHGEHRAFVVTGQYESVLPMNIYPQHLLKSILAGDLDKMEGLGIYEVVEEDLAICEFVCTSKQDVQQILREGMDYLKEQV
jgi:Na+-transporting NADH:ubiquinone oxidoreductase subunit A